MLFSGGGDPFEQILAALAFGGGGVVDGLHIPPDGLLVGTNQTYYEGQTLLDIQGTPGVLAMVTEEGNTQGVHYVARVDGGTWYALRVRSNGVGLYLPFTQSCRVNVYSPGSYSSKWAVAYLGEGPIDDMVPVIGSTNTMPTDGYSVTVVDVTGKGVLHGLGSTQANSTRTDIAIEVDDLGVVLTTWTNNDRPPKVPILPFKSRLRITASNTSNSLDVFYTLK